MADVTREEWIGLLARAPEERLIALWKATGLTPEYSWLRRPESGAIMIQGRAGGTGETFNLGEMTMTRCSLKLATGQEGHGYTPGRSAQKAQIVAFCDALMQDPDRRQTVADAILRPLAEAADRAAAEDGEKAAATKVDFFTMQRGED